MSVEQQETRETDLLVKVSASPTHRKVHVFNSAKNNYYFLRLKLSKTSQPQSQVHTGKFTLSAQPKTIYI